MFVTNFPEKGFFGHGALAALRSDMISLRIMGWGDGSTAVDYTVNAAAGVPLMTYVMTIGSHTIFYFFTFFPVIFD